MNHHPRIPSVCPPGFLGRYIIRPGDTMFNIAADPLIFGNFNIYLASRVVIEPFREDEGVSRPVILEAGLDRCRNMINSC